MVFFVCRIQWNTMYFLCKYTHKVKWLVMQGWNLDPKGGSPIRKTVYSIKFFQIFTGERINQTTFDNRSNHITEQLSLPNIRMFFIFGTTQIYSNIFSRIPKVGVKSFFILFQILEKIHMEMNRFWASAKNGKIF